MNSLGATLAASSITEGINASWGHDDQSVIEFDNSLNSDTLNRDLQTLIHVPYYLPTILTPACATGLQRNRPHR
jgi:hypothetical protein